ncbi:HWE histidine kinase domain-containing protein [Jannaschia seosinensis]|uniref:HWE histidine kinase domain-containing protein n=1 Tax=Jannaschia seosinensis TaxID=313367 RepID=UPI00163FBCB0|nr:sensor histidine kinase [Jannaschia seosinensis]
MLALEAGGFGSWESDFRSDTGKADTFVAELYGLDASRPCWSMSEVRNRIHPEDRGRVDAATRFAIKHRTLCEVEFRDRSIDPLTGEEGARWLAARGRVVEWEPSGAPRSMVGVTWDATEAVRQRQTRALMADEMNHRVKNAFAVLGSLVTIGAREADNPITFAADLRRQIGMLSEAHDVSVRLSGRDVGREVELPAARILEDVLAPWRGTAALTLRVDETLMLGRCRAPAFAMLVHELATNAVKYGPLGEVGGVLSVALTAGPDGHLEMEWNECRAVPVPGRNDLAEEGFGSILMRHCLGALRGRVQRELRAEGLWLKLTTEPVGPY